MNNRRKAQAMNRLASPLVLTVIVAGQLMAQEYPTSANLDSLIATERRFAARCQKVGIRDSFLEFFADSALVFVPEPVPYRRAIANRPAPSDPLVRSLVWEPVTGDIAGSGELGFLMGPSVFTDRSQEHPAPHWGFYLSVWKRDPGGRWKVVLDVGTDATESVKKYFGSAFASLAPPLSSGQPYDGSEGSLAGVLMSMDTAFTSDARQRGLRSAYDALLASGAGGLFDGIGLLTARDSLLSVLSGTWGLRVLDPTGGDLAASGDFGYSYGSFWNPDHPATAAGYYVRIWRRGATGWRIVVEKSVPAGGDR
jgi:ketosteroid isomerase-like protein